jgi:pimeloyl-ACP methyl ester carboxylesterase
VFRWDVATIALGLSILVLVGLQGSALWRIARAVVVVVLTVAALWVEHRQNRALRGVGGLIVGLIGTSAGFGIGMMHVVKSDLDVVGVAGLGALVAGLYLLVAAAVLLFRVTPGWWRLFAIPVVLALFQFVLVPFSVAIYSTNLPAIPLGSATPATHGFAYQNVTLKTPEGVHLAAWYIPSHNGAAVVLLHGAGSTRTSVLDQASVLGRHGYGVLLVDARGHGQSAGNAQDNGWWGNSDTSSAITWLEARPDVVGGKVGVVGISMGGEEAIGAVGADPRIRAVVTEGAIWRGAMDDRWLPHSFTGYVDRASLSVQTAVTGLLTSAPTPPNLTSSLKAAAPRPVLLIAGKPELQGDQVLRDASPANVTIWKLPDTGHTSGLATHPAAWEAHVIGFLDRALQPVG